MRAVRTAAAVLGLGVATVSAQAPTEFCDAEYQCEYRTTGEWLPVRRGRVAGQPVAGRLRSRARAYVGAPHRECTNHSLYGIN